MKTLVIIPAHDEALSLPRLIHSLRALQPHFDILVVDDASQDATAEWLRSEGIRSLRLVQRLGVGGAMRAGLRWARNHDYEIVVRMDADGQHPTEALATLMEPVLSGEAVAAVGSRFLGAEPDWIPWARRLTQRVMARALSRLTGRRVSDPTSGFWVFGKACVELLSEHHPTGYAEPELHLLLSRHKLATVEIPVTMRAREAGRSTLSWDRASVAVARAALAMLVVPLRNATRSHGG